MLGAAGPMLLMFTANAVSGGGGVYAWGMAPSVGTMTATAAKAPAIVFHMAAG